MYSGYQGSSTGGHDPTHTSVSAIGGIEEIGTFQP